MPQVIIASVDPDCDGPFTSLYRFDVPPCVTRAMREGDDHAAARWIDGVVHIGDASEWFPVTSEDALALRRIDHTAWSHSEGIDYQSIKGNIFA